MEVTHLDQACFDEASVVMADAFLDDPGWSAAGPDDPVRRHRYIRRVCRGVLRVTARCDGPIWQVERDGRTVGVLASLEPGRWPPAQIPALVMQAPGPVLAGPIVLWRSLSADSALHRGHPPEPHLFVWMLTVGPAAQRTGIGRALLSTAIARADELSVPTYLDTANPANLPYYASFGFETTGETRLPRGATLWFMVRHMR